MLLTGFVNTSIFLVLKFLLILLTRVHLAVLGFHFKKAVITLRWQSCCITRNYKRQTLQTIQICAPWVWISQSLQMSGRVFLLPNNTRQSAFTDVNTVWVLEKLAEKCSVSCRALRLLFGLCFRTPRARASQLGNDCSEFTLKERGKDTAPEFTFNSLNAAGRVIWRNSLSPSYSQLAF